MGFVTFLLAFSLQRMKTAKGWYGFMLGASVAGALVGVILVPRARKVLSEPQMLALSIWSVALAGVLAAVVGGLVIQAFLAFVIGLASAASKPAFDALVQRYVPTAAQGRGSPASRRGCSSCGCSGPCSRWWYGFRWARATSSSRRWRR